MGEKVYKKIKNNKKKFVRIVALIAFIVFIIVYYNAVTIPYVKKLSEETVAVKGIDTINQTNEKVQRLRAFYGDLFEFEKNNEGDITFIKSNTALINQITMLANTEIQNALNDLQEQRLDIPAGAFTGSSLFSGIGFKVPLTIVSIGKCNTEFLSDFYSVGINHALHRLVLNVGVDIEVLVPWHSHDVSLTYQILLAENVIVGKIPSTYLSGESFDPDYIDLIPN